MTLPIDRLKINHNLTIPLEELRFRFTSSSGPGGQKVNRTATRVELTFDVSRSPSLMPRQRDLIRRRLGNRIDRDGVLHLASQATASQWRNREDVTVRFCELLARSLRTPRRRVATRPTRRAIQNRLEGKKRRGMRKRGRGRVAREE